MDQYMNKLITSFITITLLLLSNLAAAELSVGDQAPDFKLQASDGKTYQLSDFKGQKAIVLAWFPRAFTNGCTIECKSLADNGHLLKDFNAQYFMASTDELSKNKEFAQETKADFPLLSDPTAETADAYGVSFMGYAKRHTFYIDKTGKIVMIDRNVRPATSAEDMAKHMSRLDF
ncbi:peroxiredoxin [Psychrosphaera saromensis]|uniref:Peroxiredoxin n=2 Tax=Psychrosphaera saromensis TaxID=716813 RepID=A0A2S7UY49_9GAMM|nr:peroxiredoxin [Psychrosphaera saromensis]GHB56063.1 peroxiredoxin [Psychrosphaera saromensis]GLQ13825.1 peroxiredoxin [Psychrosphaera saromensis]